MLLWFLANAAIGAWNISKHGASAFQALSPHYMYYYWAVSGRTCTGYDCRGRAVRWQHQQHQQAA